MLLRDFLRLLCQDVDTANGRMDERVGQKFYPVCPGRPKARIIFLQSRQSSDSTIPCLVTSPLPTVTMPPAWDADSASSTSGQSKRPPLNHQESDSHSESSGLGQNQHHPQHHHKVHHRHQRQHPVGRLHHARAPKQPKLSRRHTSPPDENHQRLSSNSHRRVLSDAKLSSADSSSANLTKSGSQSKLNKSPSQSKLIKSPSNTKLKRNRSHAEIGKRTRSSDKLKASDKLKRASSTTHVYQVHAANNKTQVHFDLGQDDQDDEWVDASGSNSPYLSRKGSINSSNHSAPAASASGSRPVTPSEHATGQHLQHRERHHHEPEQPGMSTPERQRVQHKEYLTSRLLQRTPSHGAPPQMTADSAQVSPRQFTPASVDNRQANTLPGSNQDELTSRFVEAAGSGVTSEGSFYRPARGEFRRFDDVPRTPRSVKSLPVEQDDPNDSSPTEEVDESALAPKAARRAPPSAQASRTQQKLNLQRASSVIEPGQAVGGVGSVVGATPLIGVGGPGYDGGNSRDPRVGKLLERTGLEYFVVRRYTSSVARSLDRLNHLPGHDKSQRIPRLNTASVNGKRSTDLTMRHTRNVSMPDPRRPVTPKRPTSVRTNGAASSFEGKDDDGRLAERLSGMSLVGGEEEDNTAALLRSLWDKSMELSASTD